jgi:cytochrome c-type biogenesis protein CcmH/NrfF
VVYAKPPFAGAEQVYRYLGRYTHRIAISNTRLEAFDEQCVRFATKHGKTVTLSPQEFIRRFLLHVLPEGFHKIRHYGLLAASNLKDKLELARRALAAPKLVDDGSVSTPTDAGHESARQLQTDLLRCPQCAVGTMLPRPLPALGSRSPPLPLAS